uniref:Ovule protein n=1 Tax=Heterorhabditis bacteriophora TaxID=37862 RepID=A0A1I7WAB4_HETBA
MRLFCQTTPFEYKEIFLFQVPALEHLTHIKYIYLNNEIVSIAYNFRTLNICQAYRKKLSKLFVTRRHLFLKY